MATKKPVPLIPFVVLESQFTLRAAFGRPAVTRNADGHYICILVGMAIAGGRVTERYDYFDLDPTGLVLSAPRGHAKNWKPARITGMDAAVARYANAAGGAE